jgi:hypothetical protein
VTIGKPYSATAVTHTIQVLADGSQIERTQSQAIYRDEQGRTRIESSEGRFIQIVDRVAGLAYSLDTIERTARTTAIMTAGRGVSVSATQPTTATNSTTTTQQAALDDLKALAELLASREQIAIDPTRPPWQGWAYADLGTQFINGVQAKGVRTTNTIPVGAIGNNRELKTVSERWESRDLGILVKSVNTDPRFGTTTYELTNISQSAPDPSLFRVPADYAVLQAPKRN